MVSVEDLGSWSESKRVYKGKWRILQNSTRSFIIVLHMCHTEGLELISITLSPLQAVSLSVLILQG